MTAPTHDQISEILNQSLNRSQHSVAAYILGSYPYLTDKDKDAVGAVGEVAAADAKFTDRILHEIDRLGGVPQTSGPDPMIAELNYLSYPHLLDVVIRNTEKEIPICKERIKALDEAPKAKELLDQILAEQEAHLTKLRAIREKRY